MSKKKNKKKHSKAPKNWKRYENMTAEELYKMVHDAIGSPAGKVYVKYHRLTSGRPRVWLADDFVYEGQDMAEEMTTAKGKEIE